MSTIAEEALAFKEPRYRVTLSVMIANRDAATGLVRLIQDLSTDWLPQGTMIAVDPMSGDVTDVETIQRATSICLHAGFPELARELKRVETDLHTQARHGVEQE